MQGKVSEEDKNLYDLMTDLFIDLKEHKKMCI